MRKNLIRVHLYLAAFLAPAFLLTALSGGLYLVGIKGQTVETVLNLPDNASLDFASASLEKDVTELLTAGDIDHKFEYIKSSGSTIQTRPTSRASILFKHQDDVLTATLIEPDLQKSMIELHKGHGPTLFKTYQKLVAVGLLIIVISGVWMGFNSTTLRWPTAIASGLGLFSFLILIFFA